MFKDSLRGLRKFRVVRPKANGASTDSKNNLPDVQAAVDRLRESISDAEHQSEQPASSRRSKRAVVGALVAALAAIGGLANEIKELIQLLRN